LANLHIVLPPQKGVLTPSLNLAGSRHEPWSECCVLKVSCRYTQHIDFVADLDLNRLVGTPKPKINSLSATAPAAAWQAAI